MIEEIDDQQASDLPEDGAAEEEKSGSNERPPSLRRTRCPGRR